MSEPNIPEEEKPDNRDEIDIQQKETLIAALNQEPEMPQPDTGETQNDIDTKSAENNVFSGNSAAAQFTRHDMAAAGAGASIEDANTSTYKTPEQIEEEKRRKTDANISALATIESIAEFNTSLEKLGQKCNVLGLSLAETGQNINEIQKILGPRIHEMDELIKRHERELEIMKNSGASEDEIKNKENELNAERELKEAYVNGGTTLSNRYENAQEKLESDKLKLESLEQRIKSGNVSEADLKELETERDDLAKSITSTEKSVNDIKSQATVFEKSLERSQNLHKQITQDGKPMSAAEVSARNLVIKTFASAIADGDLTTAERNNLRELSKDLGYDDEQINQYAKMIDQSGIRVQSSKTGANGEAIWLTGADAQNEILEGWQTIKSEREAALAETQSKLDETEDKAAALQAEIKQNDAIIQKSDADVQKALTTGTALEQDANRASLSAVGENVTYVRDTIKDIDGKEVSMDVIDGKQIFYHLNEHGQAQYYDKDDLQIINFQMRKNGDAPLQSSISGSASNEPEKRYANENDNISVMNAQAKLNIATAEKEKDLATLDTMKDRITNLRAQANMQEADINALDKIKAELENGSISPEQARAKLDVLKDSDTTKTAGSSSTSTEKTTTSANTLETPKFSFAETQEAQNKAENRLEEIAKSGGALSQAEYDKLKTLPGMSQDKLDDLMAQNKVRLDTEAPVSPASAPNMTMVKLAAGISIPVQTISTALPHSTSTIQPTGMAGMGSVLDDYPQYNEPNATYSAPINNGVNDNTALASDKFAQMQQNPSTSGGTSDSGLTPEQALELQRIIELKQSPAQGFGGGISGA